MTARLDTLQYDLSTALDGDYNILIDPEHEKHSDFIEKKGLIVKHVNWKDNPYLVVKYDKTKLTPDTITNAGLFRSVVVSLNSGKIVSFSPPKSVGYHQYSKVADAWENTRAEEFVEGTMVNVFHVDGEWEIATRSMIGANGRFYNDGGKSTFRSMFLDAVRLCASNGNDPETFYTRLDPTLSYSFVFQHPDNQIVTPKTKPELYLVRAYRIEGLCVTEYLPNSPEVTAITRSDDSNVTVDSPYTYELGHLSDFNGLEAEWQTMNRTHTDMGVVLVNQTNNTRTKLRNPSFEMVRNLRGNQPKLQYQYLSLRKEGKVGQYLRYFKQASDVFSKYRSQLHMFTKTLHENYVSCFVRKDKALKEYPAQFKTHMYALHGMFLSSLRENGDFISMKVVIDYVNELPTARLMYSLNWHPRKNVIMEKQADMELSNENEKS